MAAPDLSNVPDADLKALASGSMANVSEPTLRYLSGQPQQPVAMAPDVNTPGIVAKTVGRDLWGAAGTAANAVANIPHGVVAGVDNALQHAAGVAHPVPTHALEVTNTTPEMREFQGAVGASPLVQNPVSQAVIGGVKKVAAAHPEAADLVSDAANIVPGIAAARGVEGTVGALRAANAAGDAATAAKAAGALAPAAAANEPIAAGRALGFKFRPSDVASRAPGMEVPGQIREGLTGSGELQKELNAHNTGVGTQHAAQEIGLPVGTKTLRDPQFDQAEAPHLQVYTDTGQKIGQNVQGSPEVLADLETAANDTHPKTMLVPKARSLVLQARNALATGNYTGARLVSDMSTLRKLGARGAAGSLEDEMARILNGAGNPQQLAAFQNARTGLAKIQDVRNATTGGQVDLQDLKRLNEAKPGLLTGRLKVMADAAAAAPNSMRLPAGGVGSAIKAPTIAGLVEAGAGKVLKRLPGMNIGGEGFQARAFGPQATPADIAARVSAVGRRPAAPVKPFTLSPPPGATGVVPSQVPLELAPGLGPRPNIDLEPAPGAVGEGPSRQLGMEIAQGRPLAEQTLALEPSPGSLDPYQRSLLGREGTPEGGSRAAPKGKARGKK